MSDAVAVAMITGVGGPLVVGLLGWLSTRATGRRLGERIDGVASTTERLSEHTRQVRNQVQNSHSTNLRDDLDEKFESLNARVDNVVRAQVETVRSVGAMRRKQDAMGKRLDEHLLGSESDDR